MGEKKNEYEFWSVNLIERNHLSHLGTTRRIILKCIVINRVTADRLYTFIPQQMHHI